MSGPGIGTTSIVWNRPDQHSLGTLTETTFLWDVTGMTDAPQAADWVSQPPPGELGPKYTVVYHFGRDSAIRQDVYPFADADPVPALRELDATGALASTVATHLATTAGVGA